MATVDIPTPTQGGISKGGGAFGTGLPIPILLALIGGGVGLVVLIRRQASGGTSSSQKGTLLPNTAVMLGSLQQSVLDLQGQVSMGNADLTSQVQGLGENLGIQLDTQSALITQDFGNLNTYLQQTLGTIQGSENAVSSAIAQLGTQNAGLADSLTHVLTNLQATDAFLQGMNSDMAGANTNILNQINGVMGSQSQMQQILSAILAGQHPSVPPASWSALNGNVIVSRDRASAPGQTMDYVAYNGKLYALANTQQFQNAVNLLHIPTNKGNVQGDQDINSYITLATISEQQLRQQIAGTFPEQGLPQ